MNPFIRFGDSVQTPEDGKKASFEGRLRSCLHRGTLDPWGRNEPLWHLKVMLLAPFTVVLVGFWVMFATAVISGGF